MVFHTAFPLRCCAKGGRKVFMVCDGALAKDVEPRFQIYHQGRHLEEKDDLLNQPRLAGGQQVTFPDLKKNLTFSPLGACLERDAGIHHTTTAAH